MRRFVDAYGATAVEKAAERIVTDLKKAGPYYTGHFEENWVVRAGDVRIEATQDNPLSASEKRLAASDGTLPLNRRITPTPIPKIDPDGDLSVTIGNRASYRNQAMDLVPGRVRDNANNTAPRDWYAIYTEGGPLSKALQIAAKEAGQDKRIRGFKSDK